MSIQISGRQIHPQITQITLMGKGSLRGQRLVAEAPNLTVIFF